MSDNIVITGQAEILAKLRQLKGNSAKNAIRRSLRKGANVIKNIAVTNAKQIDDPQTREAIYKNISVQSGGRKRENQAGGPMMRVGVRGGARPISKSQDLGLPGGNTTYWRFVEFGTSKDKAQPFMRPAMETGANGAFNAIVEDFRAQLDKELAKLT